MQGAAMPGIISIATGTATGRHSPALRIFVLPLPPAALPLRVLPNATSSSVAFLLHQDDAARCWRC
jgi:hypothetical protein